MKRIPRMILTAGALLALAAAAAGQVSIPGYTAKQCAAEGGTCASRTYPVQMVYGAGNKVTTSRSATGPLACTNAVWGDPAYGTVKACYILTPIVSAPVVPGYGVGPAACTSPTVTGCWLLTPAAPVSTAPASPTSGVAADPASSADALVWSAPATWGGAVPAAGADIVVPAGKTVVLDQSITVGNLDVEGTLAFASQDINLTAASIHVGGTLQIGTAAQPYTNRATITLNGQPPAVNDGVARGLTVMGGTLALYGTPPAPVWTRINADAAAGATALTMAETTNWKAGDQIVVGPTDFKGINPTERIALASDASGTSLALAAPLAKYRWGRLQYLTDAGMALQPDPAYTPPASPAPTVLDERAVVGNLSRNIVIQGADDAAWATRGFGAHVMVMDLASRVVIDGVEFRRMGQAGVTGRYPVHFHMLSYSGDTGASLGDASTIKVSRSTVSNSSNRCMVLHGTNGATLDGNICYEIKGHAYFLENAVERRNTLTNNLSLVTHNQSGTSLLQVNEGDVGSGGASGFWLTNPDNVMTGNVAAEADGNGIWMAFPMNPHGLSAKVPMKPYAIAHALFDGNQANSNGKPGMQMQQDPCDDAGNLCLTKYTPTSDEGAHEFGDSDSRTNQAYRINVELKHASLWKNGDGAYRNRVYNPIYTEWVTADNPSTQMAGAALSGLIQRSLFIGYSLNSATRLPAGAPPPSALATYAQRVIDKDNTFVGFAFAAGQPSGMFNMEDYYLQPVILTTALNTGNRLINSSPGYRVLPPNLWTPPSPLSYHYTLASAIWDPVGLAGPAGNYWVYDVPFLTGGQACTPVAPAGQNGQSCAGPYYGVVPQATQWSTDIYNFTAPLTFTRLAADGSTMGMWVIPDGAGSGLPNMRHAAFVPGGTYTVTFPGRALPTVVAMTLKNAYRPSDSFMLGVSFDGARTVANGYQVAGAVNGPFTAAGWSGAQLLASKRTYHAVGSLAEVQSGDGTAMWQDKANNLVWIKWRGGLPQVSGFAAGSEESFSQPQELVLIGG